MGLSLSGDEVSVKPLPPQFARAYLETLDLEVGFNRRGHEIAEQFSADDIAKHLLKIFDNVIFAVAEVLVFEYHGQNLKAMVTGLSVVELPQGNTAQNMGILMNKTDITIGKAADSLIKIKSSAKKYVHTP